MNSLAWPFCAMPARMGFPRPAPPRRAARTNLILNTVTILRGTLRLFGPLSARVFVRYNPAGDPALNQRQAAMLKRLSDYLRAQEPEPVHV